MPRGNQRMAEILNPMGFNPGLAKASSTSNFATGPEEAEQLRRMTPQGNLRGRDIPPHVPQRTAGGRIFGSHSSQGVRRGQQGAQPAGDPDDDGDDDDDDRGNPGRRRSTPFRLSGDRNNLGSTPKGQTFSGESNSTKVAHFDLKLKYETYLSGTVMSTL